MTIAQLSKRCRNAWYIVYSSYFDSMFPVPVGNYMHPYPWMYNCLFIQGFEWLPQVEIFNILSDLRQGSYHGDDLICSFSIRDLGRRVRSSSLSRRGR